MSTKSKIIVSLIFVFVGFMIAIQIQSIQKPTERDTRDMWEIRAQLQNEQELQQKLFQQIDDLETVLKQYQDNSEQEQINALMDAIDELKVKAGLTEKTGSGLTITIDPIFQESAGAQRYPSVSPELLNRLINELNTYGATDISISNERYISLTAIRFVNGETYVNNRPLPDIPFSIKVLANDPDKLLDYMVVSQSKNDFAIENMTLEMKVKDELTLPSYEGALDLDLLEVDDIREAGEE